MTLKFVRNFAILAALVFAVPAASFAQFSISVRIGPPALPVYAQPVIPAEGYIWTPGYWAYDDVNGYYWVPGVWVQPPTVGYLWTPAYWGWEGGLYVFHAGYWGPHIGFYGGINYGFGYSGHGYEGGYWNGGHFFYNTQVNRIGGGIVIHNTYVRNVTVVNNTYVHTSFAGGPGGVPARPTPQENMAMHENHVQATAVQQQHFQTAAHEPSLRASVNGGHPAVAAARTPEEFQQRTQSGIQRGGFGNNAASAARPQENGVRPATAPVERPNQPAARQESAPRQETAPRPQPSPRPQAEPRPQPAPRPQAAPRPAPHPAPKPAKEEPKK